MSPAERQALQGWWRGFVESGELPSCFERVQGRLIRAVHRAPLAGGEVFVKTMTFPRGKDRLRYLLRALPAKHEAEMLRATAAAGVPCPEVVAAFSGRRLGLPRRSMLVLRALPAVCEQADPEQRAVDEVHLALRLLRAGIYHGDLHGENFVRLASGALAVLDLQSARRFDAGAAGARRRRCLVAARMLRARSGAEAQAALDAMRGCGLLASAAEVAETLALRDRERARYDETRIRRCMQSSTEFERRISWRGVCYRLRSARAGGRWIRGCSRSRDAWVGQRIQQLRSSEVGPFGAYFQKWWWLGGGASLYVSRSCSDDQIEAAVESASAAARALRSDAANLL